MSSHKPRRPCWPVINNTFAIAQDQASKLDPASVDQIVHTLKAAATAMREGVATRLQWSILSGSLDVAKAIERQGVVRGLHEHLASADAALKAIYGRADQGEQWRPTVMHFFEIDAVDTFVNLHAYQCRQLSLAEYKKAIASATGQIRSSGGRVTLARDLPTLQACPV